MKILNKFKMFSTTVFVGIVIINMISCNGSNELKKVKLFAQALNEIITDFYMKRAMVFDIVAADIRSWQFAADVIHYLLQSS